MTCVRNENLSVTMEAFFQPPVVFDKSALKAIAASVLEQFANYGLNPRQVWQRLGDQLFDYELSCALFNNQAHIRFGSERLSVNIQNARSQSDLELLSDCLVRAVSCVGSKTVSKTTFQSASHAVFDNEADSASFFEVFVDTANKVIGGGRIVLVQETDWLTPVRLLVEKSLSFKNAAFLTWSTEISGAASRETLQSLAYRFETTAQKLGLQLRFE